MSFPITVFSSGSQFRLWKYFDQTNIPNACGMSRDASVAARCPDIMNDWMLPNSGPRVTTPP
jgi:hypothetical protein